MDDPFRIKYDGTVKDRDKNPVYALLIKCDKMPEDEIKAHIRSWWFNLDENKLFEQARVRPNSSASSTASKITNLLEASLKINRRQLIFTIPAKRNL